jgi:predicted DNA-binding ribbon-helix-helix protein
VAARPATVKPINFAWLTEVSFEATRHGTYLCWQRWDFNPLLRIGGDNPGQPSSWSTDMTASRLINRNVIAQSGRTSMRLEPELWEALQEICLLETITLSDLVQRIERENHPGGRTSAIRVHVVTYFRNIARASVGASAPSKPARWRRMRDQPTTGVSAIA